MFHLYPAVAELRNQRFRMTGKDDDRSAAEKALDPLLRLILEAASPAPMPSSISRISLCAAVETAKASRADMPVE